MAYPERLLDSDEEIAERLHPHWITLVPATIWFLAVVALASFASAETTSHVDAGTKRTVLLAVVLVVAVALLLRFSLPPVMRWRSTHYVFTNRRVLIRRGVFTRVGHDIPLDRINDVAFSQTVFDRIVGAGTLTIESAGEHGQETLYDLPRSDRQQQLLNELIEDTRRRD